MPPSITSRYGCSGFYIEAIGGLRYTKTEEAEWKSLQDIKQTFNSVDYVGNQHYVFNIKGNDFRLVVVIKFTPQHVFIRFIGTHAEYDKITDIQNL